VLRRVSEWKFSARRQSVGIVVDPPIFDDPGRLDEIAEQVLLEFVIALITPDTARFRAGSDPNGLNVITPSAARCFLRNSGTGAVGGAVRSEIPIWGHLMS
jgi:hypothetical protein